MALTTKTDSPEAYILRLPVELLEIAANYAPLEDIMSLRLLSKELNDQLKRTYEQVKYSELTFYIANTYSMQTLEHLSKHPVLGKYMKTIQLAEGHLISWRDRRIHRKDTLPPVRPSAREQKNALGAIRKAHNRLVYEQDAHLKQADWQQYLTRALINIKSRDGNTSVNVIALSAEDAKAFAVVGRTRMERLAGYKDCFDGSSCLKNPGQIVGAILNGTCPISVLHLGTARSPVDRSSFTGLGDHPEFSNTFGKLTELYLYLGEEADGSDLATTLANIPALKKLHLASDWGHQNLENIDIFLTQASLPALQDLELRMYFRDAFPIVFFLRKNAQSLKQVTLSKHTGTDRSIRNGEAERIRMAGRREGVKVLVAPWDT
ncbi:hypothetical protein KC343_g1439 [Hortaea werneckii]|nr:hypothetical protein KC352_g15272 [Hortaea werneckii]KAI7571436.1 hypothetical protein KC317_g1637 [Hortaea werneckii]KAI7626214.1 hypothetical protein KC346_g1373 [Hortaea werneckii]KAI7636120.1 hypothetical protein KC343_g1439 [Hortaea werneckii]KAI7642735.1 hypothetical protein KC319_g12920 [Hortaea werneckii]